MEVPEPMSPSGLPPGTASPKIEVLGSQSAFFSFAQLVCVVILTVNADIPVSTFSPAKTAPLVLPSSGNTVMYLGSGSGR